MPDLQLAMWPLVLSAGLIGHAASETLLYGWGKGDHGRVGVGDYENKDTPTMIVGANNGHDIVGVDGGEYHSLAYTADGKLFSWGAGGGGSLGTGDTRNAKAPQEVPYFSSRKVKMIGCGYAHSIVLTQTGEMFTFGVGTYGQLGLNGTHMEIDPQRVKPPRGAGRWTAIAAGAHHSLAVTHKGRIYAWGQNKYGQLGLSGTSEWQTPQRVRGLIDDEKEWKVLAAGDRYSIAVGKSGKVYMWGNNHNAEEGWENKPFVVHALTGKGVTQVAAGVFHTMVLTKDRKVYAWGWGHYGQLGTGSSEDSVTPQMMKGLPHDVVQVAAGFAHSYILAASGDLYTVGWGEHAQLGFSLNGEKSIQRLHKVTFPAEVQGPNRATAVFSGWYHGFVTARAGCPDDCSGHGKCELVKCVCNAGYSGVNCGKLAHLNPLFRGKRSEL
jgi:alpha-tubulin suppressor-like RCC1 family protein